MKLHNTIIYLIGIPAVGKYTVAKVVDNQLINTPVFSVVWFPDTTGFMPRGLSSFT